ncbi:MAG TPA: glycosyl transferase, partial [Spirochaetia bacterium]|nr:glycosyl transferase [Spirochaetia bacterium]
MQTRDPFLPRRALVAFLAAAVLGIVFFVASLLLDWPTLPTSLAGCFLGLLAGWAWNRRSKHGIARRLLKDHARWLVSDETVLILQAPLHAMHAAVSLLREGGDVPPAVFILHPKRATLADDAQSPRVPFLSAQLRERAERLALDHQVDFEPHTGVELFMKLQNARRQIHEICMDLTEAARLEQGTPPTAEWILDNEYVIEGNARDVRVNLPRQFCRQLPSLKGVRSGGLPRIYDIACELVDALELRLDRENITAFIDAYQSAGPLAIGELWALPQMLRIALIETIRNLALSAATELREREIADFWANRLIRANRRGPEQLFAILAELAITQPGPSPYFAGQLVDHLYDEEAALVLVQGWLERTYHQPLREINLREQNRQAKDQISIGNAFTSLRQLALLDWRQIFELSSRVEQLLRKDPAGVYPGMDFDTRDRYRRIVEELSRLSGRTEEGVAQRVLTFAAEAATGPDGDERRRHVGTYLIGEGRRLLVQQLQCRESRRHRLLHWVYRHSTSVYLPALGILTVISTLVIVLAGL